MALIKQNININFSQGVETKTDPWQVPVGKFLSLINTIFTKGGLLQKRNGYAALPALPMPASYITTFNGDLTAVGTSLQALSSGYGSWVNRGNIQPCSLSVLPLIRNNLNQSQCDAAISTNGLICTVYTQVNNSTNSFFYAIADSVTGQNIIQPTALVANATYGFPRVFLLGQYFVVIYTATNGGGTALRYIAVSAANPTNVTSPTNIAASYTPSTGQAFDGVVYSGNLFLAWNDASSGGIKMTYLTSQLVLVSTVNPDNTNVATLVSVTADTKQSLIWVSYYDSGTSTGFTFATDTMLATVVAPQEIISTGSVLTLTSSAISGTNTIFYELAHNYSYDSGVPSHILESITCTTTPVVGSPVVVERGVGLASKSFFIGSTIYMLVAYQSPYQPSYFLIDSSGNIVSRIAYGNGGGYLTHGLPGVSVSGQTASVPYLFKDLIAAVNKNTNVPAGSQVAGIYSQTGINDVTFNLGAGVQSVEIGNNLNLAGGITWAYDGYSLTEQNFFLWPDSVEATGTATTGGNLSAQKYFYQVIYQWTDNQGNSFQSAPSVPVLKDISASMTSTNTITLQGPNLRLTYKTANPVKIVIFRWSSAQQVYYQVTSITAPLLNGVSTDSWTFTDTMADSAILGNSIIYTNGGVLEDVGPPSFSEMFLFDDRVWGIDSEDPNLLWPSKQVIEATPVEFSDPLTMYIPPSLGAQGPSGNLTCGFPMDDKGILFKKSSLAYFNGTGPDNTGANSQYSPPLLITSTLGCSNQKSIVFTPGGLMFEFASEAGNQIWLLARDLSTSYIGAPVESLTQNATVQSAVNIPGTNQVRFTLSSGITLMYDYYYQQWGTFSGVPAISSTLYQGLHTYINAQGQAYQESPGSYLDGSNPVLVSFTTGWLNLAGLQGYILAHWFYLLGKYLSPHKLMCSVAYDYNPGPSQGTLVAPTNFAPTYGGAESNGQYTVYGQDSPYGGGGNVENARVFLDRHRCSAFQINIQEVYDPSFGVMAGAGLTLSGINLVYAAKSGWRPISAAHDFGGQPQ